MHAPSPSPSARLFVVRFRSVFRPYLVVDYRFPRDAIVSFRPGAEINETAALRTEGVRRRVRPGHLLRTLWALSGEAPWHMAPYPG
jgi:hypothetical protein